MRWKRKPAMIFPLISTGWPSRDAKTPTGEAKYHSLIQMNNHCHSFFVAFRQCRSGEGFQSTKIGQNEP